MNKPQALDTFWNSFGIKAYEENTVPKDAQYPYITYSVSIDVFGNVVPLNASLWYRSNIWKGVNAKAEEIARKLYEGDNLIKIDTGYLYLMQGTPFATHLADPDSAIKRIYLNINAEYFTNY